MKVSRLDIHLFFFGLESLYKPFLVGLSEFPE